MPKMMEKSKNVFLYLKNIFKISMKMIILNAPYELGNIKKSVNKPQLKNSLKCKAISAAGRAISARKVGSAEKP